MTDERPTHLDLFSGIGGFALAAQWAGFRTVAFVEREKFCQKILAQNFGAVMADAEIERRGEAGRDSGRHTERATRGGKALIFGDICRFDGRRYSRVNLLTGGFPCQPYSQAGKRRGKADDCALWPEMFRVIKESKPAWIIGENVAGFVSMELDDCCANLETEGYEVQPIIIPACAVDARHRRDRVWIVGYAGGKQDQRQHTRGLQHVVSRAGETLADSPSARRGERNTVAGGPYERARTAWQWGRPTDSSSVASDANGQGRQRQRCVASVTELRFSSAGDTYWWPTEPELGRVAHGIPRRVDRLKGLGNAIVPQVAFEIIKEIRNLIA